MTVHVYIFIRILLFANAHYMLYDIIDDDNDNEWSI